MVFISVKKIIWVEMTIPFQSRPSKVEQRSITNGIINGNLALGCFLHSTDLKAEKVKCILKRGPWHEAARDEVIILHYLN